MNTKNISILLVILVAILSRFIPHPPNFTPIIAIGLFSGFYLKNNKTPCVDGIIELDVVLACQRCLDDLSITLKVNFNLAFVKHERQGEELDSHYEIYVTEEEELSTHDLICDEILLSIPMVPTHDYDCMEAITKQEIVEEKAENPFAILKNIQKADNGKE